MQAIAALPKKSHISGSGNTLRASAKPPPPPNLSPDQMEAIRKRKIEYVGKGPKQLQGGKPKSQGNGMYHKIHYCVTKDLGCICAWTESPRKVNNQGFSGKAFAELQKEYDVRQTLHIDYMARWRSVDSPLSFKPASDDSDYPYNVMVRCVADPSNCTEKNAKKWILKTLVPYFTRKGREYTRPSLYQAGDDMTTDPPSPLSEIITQPDVLEMIERAYPNLALVELLDIPAALSLYFPDAEQGKYAISGNEPGEESSGNEF
jgi:hypothetical protein